jgi:urease accessory protein
LRVETVAGASAVTAAFASSPMKLLTPRSRAASVWAFTSSFGGGLVAGDQTELDLEIGPGARCLVGTQASTKVYRNPAALPCGHRTSAELENDSLLVFASDPVQAFAHSSYTQRQEFHLAASASLVLLDWFTAGRTARGERWEFTRFQSRNDVFVDGKRTFLDSLLLDPADGPLTGAHRLSRFNCVAMLLLVGPAVEATANRALESIASRAVERGAPLIVSASRVTGGAVIRLAGESTETVGRELHHHLQPLATLLGDDPWARKW